MHIGLELPFLFIAGLLGGVLNSIAGGGSFITFPALLFVGVPAISANASNTFASCSGYLSGAFAFRQDLYAHRRELPRFIVLSLIGGMAGAWVLLQTPEALFQEAVPWLLLFALLLFVVGGRLNIALKRIGGHHRHASALAALLLAMLFVGIAFYGGFFNAGLGIVILSYLALAGHTDINAMNGIKLLVSSAVSLIAIALFVFNDAIAWYEGTVVLCGTLAGGYLAAHLSRQIPQRYVRGFVILISCSITVYFFVDVYAQ